MEKRSLIEMILEAIEELQTTLEERRTKQTENLMEGLPSEILQKIFEGFPPSHRFLATVCRKFNKGYEEYADRKGQHCNTFKCGIASASQMELLYMDGEFFSGKDFETAAEMGMLDLLKVVRERDINMEASYENYGFYVRGFYDVRGICNSAAKGGHLNVLKWAREEDVFDWRTCVMAAAGGHLEVLQWAHAQGCPWDWMTCASAAEGGHLEVLQWVRAQGCPWNECTCAWAAQRGHHEVLEWAVANGCPKYPD